MTIDFLIFLTVAVLLFSPFFYFAYLKSNEPSSQGKVKWWEEYSQSRHLIYSNPEIKDLANKFTSKEIFIESLKRLMGEDKYLHWVINNHKITLYEGLLKMKEFLPEQGSK